MKVYAGFRSIPNLAQAHLDWPVAYCRGILPYERAAAGMEQSTSEGIIVSKMSHAVKRASALTLVIAVCGVLTQIGALISSVITRSLSMLATLKSADSRPV